MQIHLALDEPPMWKGGRSSELARCPIVHVTPGLDGVSRAVNEAERAAARRGHDRLRPALTLDPSRAPDGKSILWLQLQELPAGRVEGGQRGGRRRRLLDGRAPRAYADRVVARLGQSIENLGTATLKRVVLSPVKVEQLNCNLVGGDIYSGSCAHQNLLWRPLAASPGHATAVDGLWHIGASAPRAGSRRRLRSPVANE